MLHEFALDPNALNNWARFRYFFESFGVEHGRLISEFPSPRKKWDRMVLSACGNKVDRRRVRQRLRNRQNTRRKFRQQERAYNDHQDWLGNAEAQHTPNPFHAIISDSNPRNHPSVLIADDLDETDPRWNAPREKAVPRQAADLAECCAVLLQISRAVLFVDPYFDPTARRWRDSLRPMLELACQDKTPDRLRLEFHVEWRDAEAISRESGVKNWFANCRAELPVLLPLDFSLKIVLWEPREGSQRMHARYVLTDVGGIHFDSGLDEGRAGDTTDVSLLAHSLYEHRWSDYQSDSTAFEFVDEVDIVGTRDV